ncbi:ferric reductase [Aspergillus alliaceus]|uniref:Ferric reductase n=1 Tax=Petromyces alliaceus TaxID=209559 RepID=A0A5N7BW71_PETAA|nr:ferric reductase [Aspergillus alliaceus]
MYQPPCAHACRSSITNPLNCSMSSDDGMRMSWMTEETPSPECYAENDAFLQTLAYCIYSHCHTSANSSLQRYWEKYVVGNEQDQPQPKASYHEALLSIGFAPNITVNSSIVLDSASLVSQDLYTLNYRTLSVFEKVESSHERYGLVLLLTGAIIPIGLSLIRFVPVPARWKAGFEAYMIAPPLIGNRHQVPFFNTFLMPTRGQALFIAYLIVINVVLCAVGIEAARPSAWYDSNQREVVTYVSNRAGILSFANIPLLVLYSSRNNFLLWLTDWSHSTFLLLHRWVAAICVLEACLHSVIYLQIYDSKGEYVTESKLPYWYWGVIATLAMAIIIPASILPIRQRFYELFLAWHVVFFLLALAGCIMHIYYRYTFQWGYQNWIYMALAIWGFERVFRILRIARYGIRTAHICVVDDDYIKMEIPGVEAQGHVYLYFPTLTWRVWENHPFSVMTDLRGHADLEAPTTMLKDNRARVTIVSADAPFSPEKVFLAEADRARYQRSLLIYIRTHSGITKFLRGPRLQLPVLVESAYHPVSLFKTNTSNTTNIIAIAGGVGVTALTPMLLGHDGWHRLFWAVRSKPLVESMASSLGADRFGRLNAVVFHDCRMDISRILREEVSKCAGTEVAVVVSGPPKMADEVRNVVTKLMGENPTVKLSLVEESFSW